MNLSPTTLSDADLLALKQAKRALENPSLAMRISDLIGMPMEKALSMLPDKWQITLQDLTQQALKNAFNAALVTMKDEPGRAATTLRHKMGAAMSGGVGGFFGLSALAVELPISTTIMLRAIADIARSEGESLQDTETKLACLEVFALGGKSATDDRSEMGYFAARAALAKAVSESSACLVHQGIRTETAPVLVKVIATVAERFGVQVSQKAAAQSLPALGAAGGAMVNTLFIKHFQDMAYGHFVVRRLERDYSQIVIQEIYKDLSNEPN